MQRRKLLAAMGSAAAATGAAMGTGAFTSVSANRNVSVSVADDSDALLALDAKEGNANSAYADESGDAIAVDISGENDTLAQSPSGVNGDATTIIQEIFTITNQGTQAVFVYVDPANGITPASVTAPLPENRSGGFPKNGDLYVDPQATDLPNRTSSPDAESLSLTGVYGLGGFPSGGGPYALEDFTIAPGSSFDFGLSIGDAGSDFDGEIQIELTADADLAADLS